MQSPIREKSRAEMGGHHRLEPSLPAVPTVDFDEIPEPSNVRASHKGQTRRKEDGGQARCSRKKGTGASGREGGRLLLTDSTKGPSIFGKGKK